MTGNRVSLWRQKLAQKYDESFRWFARKFTFNEEDIKEKMRNIYLHIFYKNAQMCTFCFVQEYAEQKLNVLNIKFENKILKINSNEMKWKMNEFRKQKLPIWTWCKKEFQAHTKPTTLCLRIIPVSFVHSLGPSVQNMMWRRERGGHTFSYLHFLFHYYSYSLFYISYLPHLWSFQPVFMFLCFLNIVINVCFDSGTFWPWC